MRLYAKPQIEGKKEEMGRLVNIVKSLSNPARPFEPNLRNLPNSHEGYYHFLYRLAKKVGNSLGYWVVFGVNEAVCCSHIMVGNPDIKLISIDQTETVPARNRARQYRFDYHIHNTHDPRTEGYFQELLPEKIGVVFFDTTHVDWVVLGEWEKVKPFLADEAILIFDDVHAANYSVMSAIDRIPGEYIELDHLHASLGFGVKVIE